MVFVVSNLTVLRRGTTTKEDMYVSVCRPEDKMVRNAELWERKWVCRVFSLISL